MIEFIVNESQNTDPRKIVGLWVGCAPCETDFFKKWSKRTASMRKVHP